MAAPYAANVFHDRSGLARMGEMWQLRTREYSPFIYDGTLGMRGTIVYIKAIGSTRLPYQNYFSGPMLSMQCIIQNYRYVIYSTYYIPLLVL